MELLGVKNGIAFEDSAIGLASAKAAGLHVVGVQTGLSEAVLRKLGAVHTISDYKCNHLDSLVFEGKAIHSI
jgi:beta-phosphoglucomutase-like phosphatase (HAD superfamily)